MSAQDYWNFVIQLEYAPEAAQVRWDRSDLCPCDAAETGPRCPSHQPVVAWNSWRYMKERRSQTVDLARRHHLPQADIIYARGPVEC